MSSLSKNLVGKKRRRQKETEKGKKKKTVVEAFSPSLGIVAFWSVQYPKRDRERKKTREKLKEKKEEKKHAAELGGVKK